MLLQVGVRNFLSPLSHLYDKVDIKWNHSRCCLVSVLLKKQLEELYCIQLTVEPKCENTKSELFFFFFLKRKEKHVLRISNREMLMSW